MSLIGFLLKLSLLLGYSKGQVAEPAKVARIFSFSIDNTAFCIENGKIIGHQNKNINRTKLVAVFKASGVVTVNSVLQISGQTVNDFSRPLCYTVTNFDGTSAKYVVKYQTFTDLPILYIETDSLINSKESYVKARFHFDPNSADSGFAFCEKGKIRGRGNSTWDFPKKPYKIKLHKAHSFLGMAPHKEWILLANYADKSLMRNYLSMNLSRCMQMPFTPCYKYVEVFLNGKHNGNYLLMDPIDISPFRVDIEELSCTENDSTSIKGGYLLEVDQRIKDTKDHPFFETSQFPMAIKYPKRASPEQQNYIKNYVLEAEKVLFGENFQDSINGFRKYFDEESVIKWFIVSEIYKNVDSQCFGSIYFYKTREGKLTMGPLWDFDLGAGNAIHRPDAMTIPYCYTINNPWIFRMYQDSVFRQNVKKIWRKYKEDIYHQIPVIDSLVPCLDRSQRKNFAIWTDFTDPVWFIAPNLPTFRHHVNYLRNFLKNRIDWLDGELLR